MAIRIGIPSWSVATQLLVNGEPVIMQAGSYISLRRIWKNNDQIRLFMDMQGRLITTGERSQYLAIMRGPLVLARDSRLGGPDVNTPMVPLINKSGYVDLAPFGRPDKAFWQEYKASFLVESDSEGATSAIHLLL